MNTKNDHKLCNDILYGHLKAIAKRCDINPDEYMDTASLTFDIVEVLDKYLPMAGMLRDKMETWQHDKGLQESAANDIAESVKKMREDIEAAQWVREHGGLANIKYNVDSFNLLDRYQIDVAHELGMNDIEGYDFEDLQVMILGEIEYLKQKNKYGIKY